MATIQRYVFPNLSKSIATIISGVIIAIAEMGFSGIIAKKKDK